MIKLALVDDHQLFREGMASLLRTISDFEIVGIYANGKELAEQFPHPDLVLLDLNMPEMDGFSTITFLKEHHPKVRIILISMMTDYTTIDKTLKLGTNGFLPKDADKLELDLAIHAVARGEDYFHKSVTKTLIQGHQSPHMEQTVNLTPREKEILCLIVQELTTVQMAEKLFVSVNTVETHRKNLLAKIGVSSSIGLVKFALANNICS